MKTEMIQKLQTLWPVNMDIIVPRQLFGATKKQLYLIQVTGIGNTLLANMSLIHTGQILDGKIRIISMPKLL
jgi:hypothetical protein